MKKLLKLCLILLTFPIFVFAESITLKSIEIIDKSEGLEIDNPLVDGLNIDVNPKFNKVGDFVKYKITLKNNDNKKLGVTLVNSNNKYISYEFSNINEINKNSEKEVTLLIKYTEKTEDNKYISTDEVGFLFEEVEDIITPLENENDNTEIANEIQENEKSEDITPASPDNKNQGTDTNPQLPKEKDSEDIINPTPKVPNTLDIALKISLGVLGFSLTACGIVIIIYNKNTKYLVFPLMIGIITVCALLFIGSSHANVSLLIKINVSIEPSNYLYNKLLTNETNKETVGEAKSLIEAKGTPSFTLASTTNEGLFKTEDEEGSAYYYRGAVQNNHVIFGGFCWKIVRTTGSGGVKLIYDGLPNKGVCNNTGKATSIGTSRYNYPDNSLAYVGYMYRNAPITQSDEIYTRNTNIIFSNNVTYNEETKMYELDMSNSFEMVPSNWRTDNPLNYKNVINRHYTCLDDRTSCSEVYYINEILPTYKTAYYQTLSNGDTIEDYIEKLLHPSEYTVLSLAKAQIDEWYRKNLTQYTSYLEDTIFCNDRSILDYGGWNKDNTNVTDYLFFSSYDRNPKSLYVSNTPNLTCPNPKDKFTVSDDKGNGDLTYPVGLLTIDEITFAGGKSYQDNTSYYLYTGASQWTMSPAYLQKDVISQWGLTADGKPEWYVIRSTLGLRPVVSLKPGTIIASGNGTSDTPYIIETN